MDLLTVAQSDNPEILEKLSIRLQKATWEDSSQVYAELVKNPMVSLSTLDRLYKRMLNVPSNIRGQYWTPISEAIAQSPKVSISTLLEITQGKLGIDGRQRLFARMNMEQRSGTNAS